MIIPVCLAIIKRFKVSCKDGMWEKRLFTSGVYMGYDLFLERLGKAGNTGKRGLTIFWGFYG
ncbi:MAG: hypothetical protein CL525_06135 [Aequorivita sp.]|nr:hypothetical protein [Aequorivita sp.]